MLRIINTRRLTPVTKYFLLDAPFIAASAQPGQFVMLRVRDGGERIPITIADDDRAAGTITMDPLMVNGTGMCGGCRVTVNGKAQFACVDGPRVDAHQVDFNVAIRRNKAYVKEEKQALNRLACMTARESR